MDFEELWETECGHGNPVYFFSPSVDEELAELVDELIEEIDDVFMKHEDEIREKLQECGVAEEQVFDMTEEERKVDNTMTFCEMILHRVAEDMEHKLGMADAFVRSTLKTSAIIDKEELQRISQERGAQVEMQKMDPSDDDDGGLDYIK